MWDGFSHGTENLRYFDRYSSAPFSRSKDQLPEGLRLMEVRFFASHRVPAGIMRMNGLVAAFVEIRMEAAPNTAKIFFDQRKRHLILQNPLLRRNAAHKVKLLCIDRNRFAVKVCMNRSQWIDLQIDVFQRVLRPEEKLQTAVLANLTVIFRFLRQKRPFIRLKVYKNAGGSACELCRCGDFLFNCRPRKTVDRECRDPLPDRVFNADVAAEHSLYGVLFHP